MPSKYYDYTKQMHRAGFFTSKALAEKRKVELLPKFTKVQIKPATKTMRKGILKGYHVWVGE